MKKQNELARQRLVNAVIINATEGMELRVWNSKERET